MVEIILISLVLIGIAILLLTGNGDWLIAGYNTASAEKKKTFNVKRLRIALATTMLLITIAINILLLTGNIDNNKFTKGIGIAIIVICFVYVIIGNTWCKTHVPD